MAEYGTGNDRREGLLITKDLSRKGILERGRGESRGTISDSPSTHYFKAPLVIPTT